MPEPEDEAVQKDADQPAAQKSFESMDDEAALDFFTHAAGDHDNDAKEDGVQAVADHVFERIAWHVPQRRRIGENEDHHRDHDEKDERDQPEADQHFSADTSAPDQDVVNRLPPRAQQHRHHPDHEHGIDERDSEDEWRRHAAVRRAHCHPEAKQQRDQQDLCRDSGDEKDFEKGKKPLAQKDPAFRNGLRQLRRRSGLIHPAISPQSHSPQSHRGTETLGFCISIMFSVSLCLRGKRCG